MLPSGRALNCTHGCATGYRGLSCNTKCKYPCIECSRYTNQCVGPCREGFFGSLCLKRCQQECVACDKTSGGCIGPCSAGYYGAGCTLKCPSTCPRRCDHQSGSCNITHDPEDTVTYTTNSVSQHPLTKGIPTEDVSVAASSSYTARGTFYILIRQMERKKKER